MVRQTKRDGEQWYACERCDLHFDNEAEAADHEDTCDGEEPHYLQ